MKKNINLREIDVPVFLIDDYEYFSSVEDFVEDLEECWGKIENISSNRVFSLQICELDYIVPKEDFIQNILESVDEERLSENEYNDLYPLKETLTKHINLDKLYKDMPKLYYNTGEVIEVTKQDI